VVAVSFKIQLPASEALQSPTKVAITPAPKKVATQANPRVFNTLKSPLMSPHAV